MFVMFGPMVGRIFLISINAILFMFGVSIMTAGILMKLDENNTELEINPMTAKLIELGALPCNIASVFIAFGLAIVQVAALGLFSAYTRSKLMLITYAKFVLILLLVKIVVLALWITKMEEVEEWMKMKMLKSLKASYTNDTLDSDHEISNLWNKMFLTSDCCAVNPITGSDTDFKETTWCKDTIKCNIPRTCCVGVDANSYTRASANCTSAVSGYKTMGCYDAMIEQLKSYSVVIIGLLSSVIAIELMAVVFAFQIC